MGQIKTSIEIEENVSSAFKSMNTVVSSTLNTFQNLDNLITDNFSNSVGQLTNNLNSIPSFDYWTESVGNYNKSALEAIYTTEELVQMGFKTADALNTPAQAVEQIDNSVANLKNNITQWSAIPNIEIFSSTGIERYQQEISSAQSLTNKLVTTQQSIQEQANKTNFISGTAMSDLENVNTRIIRLQESVEELENKKITTIGVDEVNPEVEELRQKINNALESQNDLNEAMKKMNASNAYSAYEQLEENIRSAENEVNNLNKALDNMDNKINTANNSSGSLLKTLLGFSAIQKVFSLVTGQIDSAIERMDTMTNYERTMTAITGSSEAAEASLTELNTIVKGTAYGLDTAASAVQNFVTRGMGIATATEEVGKWADAVAFYGDGTNETLESVTNALGKMLSKGTVSMDYLNTLTDAGINAVGIYAQATGQSSATVQSALSAGEISAYDFITTVSTAFEEGTNGVLSIAGAAKEAGGTWATSIANMKAAVTRGVIDIVDSINNALTNAGFGTILDGITNFGSAMETMLGNIGNFVGNVITLISPLVSLIQQMGTFVYENWSIIAPIIMGIVAALLLYKAAQIGLNTVNAISAGIEGAKTLASNIHAAALAMETGATFAATAAQYGFNAALLACPLTWILIIIIAIIAAIYAIVAVINKVTGSTISATGIIVGVLTTAVAFIWNIFAAVINFIIDAFAVLWNFIAAFVNFFANVFNDPVGAIARLFFDLVDCILALLQSLASAIDTIFGSNLAGSVQGWRDSLSGWVDETFGEGEEIMAQVNSEDYHLDRWAYSDAWDTGYSWGESIGSSISDFFDTSDLIDTSILDGLEGYETDSLLDDVASTASNTSSIADSMDITEEDLKYLRDIAEQEVINRYTTASINVEMNNNNNINNEADLDGIVSSLEDKIYEMSISMAEGVHS